MAKFRVWNPDHGDREDARTFDTYDAEGAVKKWAERDDAESADYRIVGGQECDVCVEDEAGTVTRWLVWGEPCPVYHARAMTEAKGGGR